jgi:hypothetical protein
MKKKDFFRKENYYLIHNYGNGGEPIFKCNGNYYYFLRKQQEYMNENWQLLAWNLLPGCYTLLVKIKSDFSSRLSLEEIDKKIYTDFGHFTLGYTKAINKSYNRKGSLFAKSFSRKVILDNYHVKRLICDIHFEPVNRNLVSSPGDWKFSSYRNALLNHENSQYLEMIRPFENIEKFFDAHQLMQAIRKVA